MSAKNSDITKSIIYIARTLSMSQLSLYTSSTPAQNGIK
jgi:hypothetical protein